MSLHRIQPWLAIWALAVLAVASAQGQGMQDMQAFAPAEMDQFGEGARADEGAFFSLEGLNWWIQAPETDAIGSAGLQRQAWLVPGDNKFIIQTNTADTSGFSSQSVGGSRLELGYIHGHDGILFSYFGLASQNQTLNYGRSDVVFDDQGFADHPLGRLVGNVVDLVEKGDPAVYTNADERPLPISFDELVVKNRVKTWGTELEYVYRGHAGPRAGIFELLVGARYLKFDERFTVEGTGDRFLRTLDDPNSSGEGGGGTGGTGGTTEEELGTPISPGTILADSNWWATSQNHIVGPQIGLRWFRQTERWTWESEARFFAGLNIQNLKQGGTLGSELDEQYWLATEGGGPGVVAMQPLYMTPTSFTHSRTVSEWSPGVELRLNLKYQLTRGVALKVGWSGLWLDGLARASNLVDYTLNETQFMGIDMKDNRQSVFMHGVSFGVDVNR